MTRDDRVLEAQLFVENQLAGKGLFPYAELLAVRDALRPYVDDMQDAGWYPDCEACYDQLLAEWHEVNQAIDRHRLAALQRWRSRRGTQAASPRKGERRP